MCESFIADEAMALSVDNDFDHECRKYTFSCANAHRASRRRPKADYHASIFYLDS